MVRRIAVLACWALVGGCGGGSSVPDAMPFTGDAIIEPDGPAQPDAGPPVEPGRDIVATGLTLDVTAHTGTAVITLAPSMTSTSASFEVQGLTISSVLAGGAPAQYAVSDGRLEIAVPPGAAAPELTIDYTFAVQSSFDGYLSSGLTFLWPYFCGNLFPCKSGPDDGTTFTLAVTGVPAGQTAVFPAAIPGEAPSYMIALAVGSYTQVDLGTTSAGTAVHVWTLPGDPAETTAATARLRDIFDWFETAYGPYSFGTSVGSVSAPWGPGAYGGMEHHPYWHVARGAMGDEVTHAHEAAHGWFGNGVRMKCWEDFVLSEGTVSYLAARSIEQTGGLMAGQAVWSDYQAELDFAVANGDTRAYPAGCNQIDLLNDPLWSSIPYMKGAFFYRAVEQQIGRDVLDGVLASFYLAHVGQAATMQDMLDAIAATGFDPTALADGWLRGLGTP